MSRRRRRAIRLEGGSIPVLPNQVQRAKTKQPTEEKQEENELPLLQQQGTQLTSAMIIELQKQYGNKAVQQMLLEQGSGDAVDTPIIEKAQLTLQTMTPEISLQLIKTLELVERVVVKHKLEGEELPIGPERIKLDKIPQITKAYVEALDKKLLGSLLSKSQAAKAAENLQHHDPFQDFDEEVARVIMSPDLLLLSLKAFVVDIGTSLSGMPAQDGKLAVNRDVEKPIEKLQETVREIETVSDAMVASNLIFTALQAIHKADRYKRL